MPVLNPWMIVGALALWIGTGLGAYFYGHNEGYNSAKAEIADSYQKALDNFGKAAEKVAKDATAEALKEFQEKGAILERVAGQLDQQRGVINAAASKLASALQGRCVLQPSERHLLECVRRPSSPGCAVPAAPSH
jgi:hypothetical protein